VIGVEGGSSTPVVLPASMVVAGMIVGAAIIALDASRPMGSGELRDEFCWWVHQTEVARNQGRAPASIISNVGEVVGSVTLQGGNLPRHDERDQVDEAVRGQDGAEITRGIGNLICRIKSEPQTLSTVSLL
jgi:hypothetical protein